MIAFPHCKINLGLHIVERMPNGYHQIETCFYPVPWSDVLEIIPASEFSFASSGAVIPGSPDDNLCVKAYREIKKNHNIPAVSIHLHKVIPSGAGLGGGSSDASFCMRLLDSIFSLNCSPSELLAYAKKLGSDCAFFLEDIPKYATGTGDQLIEINLNLKGHFMVIVKPQIHISSAEAYQLVTPLKPSHSIVDAVKEPPAAWKNHMVNDFERPVFQKYPELKKIKEDLYRNGAVYASMSGSGSAFFGIFESQVDLQSEFPDCIYWAGKL